MHYMTTAEIRESFLKFFEEKGCQRWPSSSLVPDDPSMLLTSAGMVQFKPYFLQQKHLDEPYIGTTTVQKCVRTNDIDIIGTDGRHLSFFEMLGNFAFGAYFKEEMCAWALDYSVNVLELPFEKLYFTVFEDDDETIEIWKNLGVDPSHITRLGEDDNFWRAGPTGPCGPCSEIYYDQGEDVGCGRAECAPGCDCDRFLEYWNLVFTQYDGQEDGTLAPLPKKNIDTGMGLERMAAIMQGVTSNFDTDVLRGLIEVGASLQNTTVSPPRMRSIAAGPRLAMTSSSMRSSRLPSTPNAASSLPVTRVSSQHTTSAERKASSARGGMSPRFPKGVGQMTSFPLACFMATILYQSVRRRWRERNLG